MCIYIYLLQIFVYMYLFIYVYAYMHLGEAGDHNLTDESHEADRNESLLTKFQPTACTCV